MSHRTVVSTFASPHEPTLKPKACKRASAFSAQVTACQDGFRIAPHKKNKINLCFVDRLVRFDTDKNKGQIIDIQTGTTEHQHTTSATRQVRQQWFSVDIFPLKLLFGLTGNRPQSAPACSFLR